MSGQGGGGGRGGRGGGGRGRSQGGGRAGPGGGRYGPGGPSPAGRGGPPPPSYNAPPATVPSELPAQFSRVSLQPAAAPAPAPAAVQAPVAVEKVSTEERLPLPPPGSSKDVRFPSRPGYGTLGQKCIVRANHFLVELSDRDLHHYDVTITPEVASKNVCRDIMAKVVQEYSQSHMGKRLVAYDGGKSIYTAAELPFSSKDFSVKLADKDRKSRPDREFNVSIKFAAKHSLYHLQQFLQSKQLDTPQETIQVLDVALRANLSTKYQVVGRSFFASTFGEGRLDDGLEYWKGFYQSLRPCQMGLSLNIDVSARAFYEPKLVSEYVFDFLKVRDVSRPLTDQDRLKVKRVLKGVRVEVSHLKNIRRYKISGLSTLPASQLMFEMETGEKTSVVNYFSKKYKINIMYPMLPAVQSGNDAKPVYLPMEVCRIVKGQRYTRKLNEKQVSAMLKATAQRPHERENSIAKVVDSNKYNMDNIVAEFGMKLTADLTAIEARVLPPPMIKYHESGREPALCPTVGQWNMINKKMVDPARVDFWTCVNFSRFKDPEGFCHGLIDMCVSRGMVFSPNPLIPFRAANPNQIEKALNDIHKESCARIASMGLPTDGKNVPKLQLLIIILPDITGSYGKIKKICETELGIVSQCCQPKQASKYSKQYFENVSLKINVKVGGRNSFLEQAVQRRLPYISERPTIIFGADVTHPQPGEDSSPSIAAVVASMDWPHVTKYRGLVSAQEHRVEIIEDLYKSHQDPARGIVHGGMIREQLIEFRRSTGHKPHRIIFFRDGVSEGQFSQVLLYEVDAIRKACNSLENGYLPPITFVVVQKRHHTRLFPSNHSDRRMTDKSGNILPGTVVDRKICHPTEFDFYLCSHAGIQGTSRPAHYHVLYDENKFTADGLQNLTNSLCYTYARCTRSVSIVPPAYYAHLAAFRARYYIEGEYSDSGSTGQGGGGGQATREKSADVRALPAIKDNVKAVMFYC
ncbi:unnamed protein product [Cuscuta epithymum]|uniref:Uncharacterized protein n=1 Tax=Cuscuta epithymum TaxID=186058 RepID=A0AAV0EJ98_9ASTE|nr:unnamed protein product [Cuscuta epithymum]CAH9124225.1 unnamed protein product [Cuscuta epithymum]